MTLRVILLSGILSALVAVPASAGVYSVRIQAGYSDSVVWKGKPFTATFMIDTSIPPDLNMEYIPDNFGFRYLVVARVNGQLTNASMAFYGLNDDYRDEINNLYHFVSPLGSLYTGEMRDQYCTGTMWSGPIESPTLIPGNSFCYETVQSVNPPSGITSTHKVVIREVPEPATWGMMIAGFGLVGGALRRRKPAVA